MTLACMLSVGEDDLICDFAETYQILNWESLDLSLAATLAAGLPDSSRIKRKITGQTLTLEQVLLAGIVDNLKILCWMSTKDALKGRNFPDSLLDILMKGNTKSEDNDLMDFATPEEYEAWRRKKEEEWNNG